LFGSVSKWTGKKGAKIKRGTGGEQKSLQNNVAMFQNKARTKTQGKKYK